MALPHTQLQPHEQPHEQPYGRPYEQAAARPSRDLAPTRPGPTRSKPGQWKPTRCVPDNDGGCRPVGSARTPSGQPLTRATLARFVCTGALRRVLTAPDTGAVLNLGRTVRLATPAQRAALTIRDHGCVIPACGAPPTWCEAHHLKWWSRNGTTDLGNLALVCGHHHAAIHAGIWTLTSIDGLPWATPPAWLDPHQRPRRNTLHDHARTAEHLAHQLTLDLGHHPGHGHRHRQRHEPGHRPRPGPGGPAPPTAA